MEKMQREEAESVHHLHGKVDFIIAELKAIRSELSGSIAVVSGRVDELQDKMASMEQAQQSACVTEVQTQTRLTGIERRERDLTLKLDDIENRERRNNLRFLGIPEEATEKPEEVPNILRTFLKEVLGDSNGPDIVLDHAHRGANRNRTPRPIVARFHYFEDRERVLNKTRGRDTLLYKGNEVKIFPDLSILTLSRRRECKPLTQLLTSRNIRYRWGFPFSLSFEINGEKCQVIHQEDMEKALEALKGTSSEGQPSIQDWDSDRGQAQGWELAKSQRKRVNKTRKIRKLNTPPMQPSEDNADNND